MARIHVPGVPPKDISRLFRKAKESARLSTKPDPEGKGELLVFGDWFARELSFIDKPDGAAQGRLLAQTAARMRAGARVDVDELSGVVDAVTYRGGEATAVDFFRTETADRVLRLGISPRGELTLSADPLLFSHDEFYKAAVDIRAALVAFLEA